MPQVFCITRRRYGSKRSGLCSEKKSNDRKRYEQQLGYQAILMPSGAGHDAAVVAEQRRSDGSLIPVGMIFVPCRDGVSHCKEEYSSAEAVTKRAEVLAETLLRLATQN